ncbi:hypothetical protein CASFOL_021209 [Castilleja foliolosa]|uniref:Uncharacterized protein n=1 Tax=Castilleja foliolosa TaxID=1961234 RepID=A0ABD3CVX3_9LAMI
MEEVGEDEEVPSDESEGSSPPNPVEEDPEEDPSNGANPRDP